MRFTASFILILLLTATVGHSQTLISGEIKNAEGEALGGATITVSSDSSGAIKAYGISKADGSFRINLNAKMNTLFMKVSFIGYKAWTKDIINKEQQLEVVMRESSEELREVMVEARIIQQRGDTLSFRVSAFKDQKDRVIADVLEKMPGIEIMPGGQIHYQGEPIQKYYIEGLDLLEGRYSLANNNISADDVSDVQILENHQPVKVLDSLEFSERASLNIKLKKEVTTSGTAEVGAGFSPVLWTAKITPMIFTKKQQAIVTYQANNIGNDASKEITDFSFSDFGREDFRVNKRDWLGIRQLSPPPFEQDWWLDNNVHLVSINYLIRLKKELDLKTNISYLNDTQQQMGITGTRIFTPTDTINLVENTRNQLFMNTLQSKLILERNTEEKYLKNELEVNKYWDSQRGNILTDGDLIQQRLSNPFAVMRNKLRMLRPVGKQLVTFRSNTGYIEANQSLRVSPGQFPDLLNEGVPYEETQQLLESTTFFTDNSAGFTKGIKDFNISPEVGFSLRKQQLNSWLGVIDAGTAAYLDEDFRNEIDFLSSTVYFTSRWSYQKNNWNIRLVTPLNFRNFAIKNAFLEEEQDLKRATFEPNLFVKKKLSAYWESSVSVNLSNDFRDSRNMYSGFILSQYRNLRRYNSPLPESFIQSYNGRLSYRNPLKSIFANTSYTYAFTENNLLYSNLVGEDGTFLLEAFEQDNTSVSHKMRVEASKYFRKLHTSLDVGTSYSLSRSEQYLNSELAEVNNQNMILNLAVESEVTAWLSTSYDGNFSFLQTSLEGRNFDEIRSQQHLLDFSFFPADNQFFSFETEYYYNNLSQENRTSYFMNFEYQYTFEESKVDLAVSWNNVLGTEEFVNVYSNEFSYVQSTYRLRPSQLLVSIKFSF